MSFWNYRLFGFDQEFISAGVNAYALGCTDEGLRKELADMKESGVEIEAMRSFGGNTSLKSRIASEEVKAKFGLFKGFIMSVCSIYTKLVVLCWSLSRSKTPLYIFFLFCLFVRSVGTG